MNRKNHDDFNSDEFLRVMNLQKYFGTTKAVDDLSFHVKRGEIYGLLGPNAAGKSTTIKSILGLLEIDSGEISVFGYNPVREPTQVKKLLGYVPEDFALYESMTVVELLDFIASIRRLDAKKSSNFVEKLLTVLKAKEYYHSLIASLSKGNKQKIEIIAALIHQPKLLILDEPLSGLDTRSAVILKEIFQIHIQKGGSIILSTHIMELAQALCTRIGIIHQGKIIAEGTFKELQKTANAEGGSLEKVFLELTDQKNDTEEVIADLYKTIGASESGGEV